MTERHTQSPAYGPLSPTPVMRLRVRWRIVVHGYGQLARYFLNSFTDLAVGRNDRRTGRLNRFYHG
ncbi:MAG: hypothetical protein IPH63_17640 [Flavobacteriales bacterium]|nr:hypothetical protein [Flavobacteriales bacterium]